ncbi:ParB family chromosome partitioning protein [Streptomyces sp. KhCrAH-43]|uniref:ParB/RepB/Spo0J family partition protein n=1 Tax=unclassified Streptomyces TaxID=2593676 RepID=UPI00037FB2C3|nr:MULTISPECIES: ParB N-terminal domain-containing protein [unclassified Streptomyces]MYS32949.1 ParB N-terminal domain-containing protein [Streptomyces sp. SID4920]MYX64506.1 ParB N-terminal domain-containing protein [Streptomyces sp. SID8373]RAJ45707.1 ParB family chromosome partitioning protein [Streptomyces sp. KhCrAH-43]
MTVQTEQTPTNEAIEPAVFGRLVAIDPLDFDPDGGTEKLVIVDPYNHRKKREEGDTTEPDAALIASVEEVGVQQAIILRPQEGERDGQLGIVIGQRRTLAAYRVASAAAQEGREYRKVPAIIRDDLRGVDDEALTVSMVENLHRRQASAQDDVDAAEQLALLVKTKKVPKARKRSLAAAIGRTEEELDAAHRVAQMDPETLLELWEDEVEFDWVELGDYDEVKDVSNAQVTLMRAKAKDEQEGNAKRGAWKTAMQELRAKKARTERIEILKAELAEKKVNTVHWALNWSYSTARPLEELVSKIGMPMSEQGHGETCEGHAATIDPDAAEVVWLCADWKKHGHRIAGAAQGDDGGDGESDAEADAKAEAAREERRRVKVNNLAWRTARAGREAHIADMCKDKAEAPADIKDLIMRTLLVSTGHYVHYVGSQEHGAMLAKFLGDERLTSHPKDVFTALLKKTASKRYWWVLFAHVAGYFEAEHMKDDAWRGEPHYHFGPSVRGRIRPATAEWITFLKRHGYGVTEVEAEAVTTAEQEAEAEAERRAEQERERQEWEAARAAQAEDPAPDEDEEDGDDGEEDYQYDDVDEEYEEPAEAGVGANPEAETGGDTDAGPEEAEGREDVTAEDGQEDAEQE